MQVVETLVTNNSLSEDYSHADDHIRQTTCFRPFTNKISFAKLLFLLTITRVKPSTTHPKDRVSRRRTSVQHRVNYRMAEVTRKNCKSESWGECTENKICDTYRTNAEQRSSENFIVMKRLGEPPLEKRHNVTVFKITGRPQG